MSLDRTTRKKRTGFPSSGITYGNHNVDLLISKLIPRLASITLGWQPMTSKGLQTHRIDLPCGKTPGTKGFESPASPMVKEPFSHDATTGVARAENQYRFHQQLLTFVTQTRPINRSAKAMCRYFMNSLLRTWVYNWTIPRLQGCSNLRARTAPDSVTRQYWPHSSPCVRYAGKRLTRHAPNATDETKACYGARPACQPNRQQAFQCDHARPAPAGPIVSFPGKVLQTHQRLSFCP